MPCVLRTGWAGPASWEGPRACRAQAQGWLVSARAGAGAAGGGEGGDDPAALVSVHAAAARDGHVQPKRESPARGPGRLDPQGVGVGQPGLEENHLALGGGGLSSPSE